LLVKLRAVDATHNDGVRQTTCEAGKDGFAAGIGKTSETGTFRLTRAADRIEKGGQRERRVETPARSREKDMVNGKRTLFALLVLTGGAPSAWAQGLEPAPVASSSVGAAPHLGVGVAAGTTADSLYNHYTQGAGQMQGWPGMAPTAGPGKLPPDPFAPQRMQMPIPNRNDDFAGGSSYNMHTRPDEKTIGPRLDSSYKFFREFELAGYLSEYQQLGMFGGTFLPFQSPGWLIGIRGGGVYNGNAGLTDDIMGATVDAFMATRIRATYLKLGYFVDWTEEHRHWGISHSMLTKLGPLGNVTLDAAIGFGAGKDEFTTLEPATGRFRRVEIADQDTEIRIGKFVSAYFQCGFTGEWTNYARARDEFSYGAFANWFLGGATLSVDLSGGSSGLRGWAGVGFNWGGGANIDRHPIDVHYAPSIDTISWVTRPTRRDITMQLRETPTGPGPAQIVPVILP
jgi:hypothetical protein